MKPVLRQRVQALVGQRPARTPENCFHCGETTMLGRLTTVLDGRRVVACFRAECFEALKSAMGGEDASVN